MPDQLKAGIIGFISREFQRLGMQKIGNLVSGFTKKKYETSDASHRVASMLL